MMEKLEDQSSVENLIQVISAISTEQKWFETIIENLIEAFETQTAFNPNKAEVVIL